VLRCFQIKGARMNKPMWRWMKEAAAIVGCAALILVFAYFAAVLVLSLERAAPRGLTSVTPSAEPAAAALSPRSN
jgi:hypothetical protein